LQDVVTSRRVFCAHNAWDFDRRVWEAKGLPAPSDWLDTLPHARAAGLPGGLDEIGQRLFGMGKSPVGKNLIKKLCRPERNGRFAEPTGDEVSRLVEYNITDVLLLARIYEVVQGAGESDVIAADWAINERGIYFDVAQAEKILRLERRVLDDVAARVSEMTVGEITVADLNRIDFLRNWLESLGAALPNLRRETIERFLRDQHAGGERSTIALVAPAVLAVLQARLMFSKTAMKKLPKAIQAVGADHRLRDQLIYHGGHTGRWTAEGVQVHNLPKAPNELDDLDNLIGCVDDYELFCGAVPDSVAVSDALTALIRPCFRAAPRHVLCVADFASIEARGLAWCAGEELLLQRFAAGEDVYCEFASMLFARRITKENKLDRNVGKIAMLGDSGRKEQSKTSIAILHWGAVSIPWCREC
jgi:DNA polymerase